ncbi:MAG TPA: choice-of-anchor Q domain-containing protein [Rudaea sp.]|nr:choice-of-anchor Q domain-containing protein [Rudaea sp.]
MLMQGCLLSRGRVPMQLVCCLLLILAGAGPARADVCRVTTVGQSGNSGADWSLAMDLPTALSTGTCTEIWVAQGVYKPGAVQTDAFNIASGVGVYGGFAGIANETSRDSRDPFTHVTVLSGDIDDNDTNLDGNHIDETHAEIQGSNSFHVVVMTSSPTAPITRATVLDGFVITGGRADAATPQDRGGGMLCNGKDTGNECSPTLNNLAFCGNFAGYGGALENDGSFHGNSSPSLSNITFSGNRADQSGGAVANNGSNGASNPVLGNVTFSGNSAGKKGGALYSFSSAPILRNVTFSDNSAGTQGGAIDFFGATGSSSPSLSNVILWNDTAAGGAEIYNDVNATPATIYNSVVQGSGGSGGTWVAAMGIDGGGNIDADPILGPLGNHGGATATRLLGANSSAINAGDPIACISAPVNGVDQRGVFRFEGTNILCDIGAVEMAIITDRIFANGFEP